MRRKIKNAVNEMDLEEVTCGIGSCKPNWLQRFACKETYLVVFCVSGMIIGMGSSYAVSTVSTVEKKFGLTSKQSGIMLSANDISQALFTLLLSYYGNYGNRPKIMAISFICSGLSCFVSAAPHFLFGYEDDNLTANLSPNMTNLETHDMCVMDSLRSCPEDDYKDFAMAPLIVLFIGQFLFGMSSTSFAVLGFVYLDDNVKKADTPLFYSISLIIKIGGPVLGMFLASKCLSIYIDLTNSTSLLLNDPRWLGAWWLGYVVIGIGIICCGLVLSLFPQTLPGHFVTKLHLVQESDKSNPIGQLTPAHIRSYMDQLIENDRHTKPSLANLPSALKDILTNKVWMGHLIHSVLSIIGIMCSVSFTPKYLELQFNQSASDTTFYVGITAGVSAIFGFGIPGVVLRVFKPPPRLISAVSMGLSVIASIGSIVLYFLVCTNQPVINGPIDWSPSLGSCNTECGCSNQFAPVCSAYGSQMYFSPCFAGCEELNSSNPNEYLNCKCVSSENSDSSSYNISHFEELPEDAVNIVTLGGGSAFFGACATDCSKAFIVFLVFSTVRGLLGTSSLVGRFLIALRSLKHHQKGLALGLQSTLFAVFAFIPAPILMGQIIDTSCLIWDDTCGTKGNCWVYDLDRFNKFIHFIPGVISLLALAGDLLVYIYCKDISLYDEETEQTNNQQ